MRPVLSQEQRCGGPGNGNWLAQPPHQEDRPGGQVDLCDSGQAPKEMSRLPSVSKSIASAGVQFTGGLSAGWMRSVICDRPGPGEERRTEGVDMLHHSDRDSSGLAFIAGQV